MKQQITDIRYSHGFVMMIVVSNLTKRFGSVNVVNDISFSVQSGEVAGLIGPNGAGKTTIMRILAGYLPATRGRVLIDGLDVCDSSLEVRRRIGYLPENPALYSDMRVNEFLVFRASLKGIPRSECRERVEEVKILCSIKEVESRLIGQLSRGFCQRVGLADALVHDPRLLILDEPTIGLDPAESLSIRRLISSLGSRYTVLLSTHTLSEAETTCRRILVLNGGKIVAADYLESLTGFFSGAVRVRAEIFGPWHEVTRDLSSLAGISKVSYHSRGEHDVPADATAIWGRYTVECEKDIDVRAMIYDMATRRGWGLRELGMERRRLEDVFLEMTREGNRS